MTIEDAARHYAAGDLTETGRACVELIARDPRQFDALHLLGVVCALRDQRADSVCYLLRAKALRPNDPRMLYNLGNAFASVRRFADAVDAFRQAEAAGVRDAGLHNNLGLALHGLRQFDAAIGAFQTALVLDPGHGPARFNLGRVHAAAGRLIEAEIAFRVVLDGLPPDVPPDRIEDITNELARALMALGRPEDALVELRALFAKRPEMVSLRWNESLALLLLGQYAEGWAAYQSRWLAPDHDRAHPDHCILDLEAVAGRRVLREWLWNRARSFVFSTGLAPSSAAARNALPRSV